MISHNHKCIFVHIPKCAGTSIASALGHLDDNQGQNGLDHRSIRHIQPLFSHGFSFSKENIIELARRYKRHYFNKTPNQRNKYTVTPAQYDAYFKFTFVRNPWARVFSWYKAAMRDEDEQKRLGINGHISFEQALNRFAGKGLIIPQMYWLKGFNNQVSLDYIGRFETLETDFEEICKRASIKGIHLPHKNKGTGEDYRNHYNESSKLIVSEIYKEEIELFNYTF